VCLAGQDQAPESGGGGGADLHANPWRWRCRWRCRGHAYLATIHAANSVVLKRKKEGTGEKGI
jgi:hypothetical protein